MLNIVHHPSKIDSDSKLLIAHGLYGSARNWGVISKRLSSERHVYTIDQRNHGDSGWYDSHTYDDMSQDIAQILKAHGPMDVLGHSMGGKAAMVLAVKYPLLVKRLIVADIAPVGYSHDHMDNLSAMKSIDFTKVQKRSDALEQLSPLIQDDTLKSFFLQSIDIKHKRWKLNLDILSRDMPHIVGFPDISGQFDGPTLFLSGANSTYVRPEYRSQIKSLFPAAKFAKIPNAGHWLHAERPREFEAAVRAFLDYRPTS